MKNKVKSLCFFTLILILTRYAFAGNSNLIDSFESPKGIVIGIDKYTRARITNDYFNNKNKVLKLSFGTNNFEKNKNFFLSADLLKPVKNNSLLFDVYTHSPRDITLFYKIYFASNKFVCARTKLIKRKKTTVEIPFALARSAFDSIFEYKFIITDSTEKVDLYIDNLRTEKSSYLPFKKIAYFNLVQPSRQIAPVFFSRGVAEPVFKNSTPFAFEKLKEISLFAGKGEMINYPLSFFITKNEDKTSLKLSNFISSTSNRLNETLSIGTVKYLDKRLAIDSDYYISDVPVYVENGNLFSNIPSNSVRTFWININVPESAKPDIYNNEIIISCIAGGITNQNVIPIKLQVLPFVISSEFKTNIVLNCDSACIKPEVDRFALGFFNDTNNVIKIISQKIVGDPFDDFDVNRGDAVSVFPSNNVSIATYAAYQGIIDKEYLTILKQLISKNPNSSQSANALNDINYLLKSLKTTPPLDVASKWSALLTKEQAKLTGKKYDTNAIAFVVGEQKIPNGWTKKDYDRARLMIAKNIVAILTSATNYNSSTTAVPTISVEASVSIPLIRKKIKKKVAKTVYSVRELPAKPVINGKFDDDEWRRALKIKQLTQISGEKTGASETEAKLGWYESNLYIFAICNDMNETELFDIFIKPENKNWEKYSINQNGKLRVLKSDGKSSRSYAKSATFTTNNKAQFEFEIPLTNCLTCNEEFGLNISRRDGKNIFAWQPFKKNKLKFKNIKLDGAEKIVESLTVPLKQSPLKIVACDAFALADEDIIAPEIIWEGERKILKKCKLKFLLSSENNIQYSTMSSLQVYSRQIVYLKLKDFSPGKYKLTVELIDSGGKPVSSFDTIIQIVQYLL